MRHVLLILFVLVSMQVRAEMTIETIDLKHRTANEVISVVQPMVQQGGSITGTGYKLFIKSTPANLEQLRAMIQQIDVAPQQLLITVSMDKEVLNQMQDSSARVTVTTGTQRATIGEKPATPAAGEIHGQAGNGNIKYDAWSRQQIGTERTPQGQQVRVTEGLWATVRTGQSVPVATRYQNSDGTVTETVTYQDVVSGFQVLPRVNGDNVILTIRPQSQSPSPSGGGVYLTLEMESTVTGQLGKWLTLGGIAEAQHTTGTGLTVRTQHRTEENSQIFVKVERAH